MSTSSITTPSGMVHEFSANLVVRRRTTAAKGVVTLDLGEPEGTDLPGWEPGAHVDLMLADGLVRQYSLCGDPGEPDVWRVGVLLNPNSRGGSRYVHDNLVEGASVRVRGPRNHFSLVDSPRYRFIAGGIGITPILAMLETAQRAGNEWTLLYGGRTRASMAFATDLAEHYPERVTLWPTDERGHMDLESLLKDPQDDTLVYCCGPEGLLSAVEQQCAHWPAGTLHIERFAAKAPPAEQAAAALERFEVVCHRSGITVEVPADLSILEALEDADVPVLGSCYEGVCGTCEAKVLEGAPAHRDSVLTEAEQASGTVMMTCVSRSRTERIVLDL
jgi:ferredoxin-NADP reductase